MNIREAKEEIRNTIQAYLAKDELGEYRIPQRHQRPVLLMGPPGIGKTAIMEQIARECRIGLVAYAITHHTRQSAVGLPVVKERSYGGKTYSVTEYTMSEIIGAVYEKMEITGLKEGILFIDEINCVSETLAPTMLQLLQAKTFGNHRVPQGWVIVAAGNPPEYNKSVRDFDIVTLDRVKLLSLEVDYEAWKDYAYRRQIHPGILSYLELKKECFYQIHATVDGMEFVTARGWEDLSELLWAYEELKLPVHYEVAAAYLHSSKVSQDFAAYYELYQKYRQEYPVEQILQGRPGELPGRLEQAPFDERLSMISLLLGRLNEEFVLVWEQEEYLNKVYEALLTWKDRIGQKEGGGKPLLELVIEDFARRSQREQESGLLEERQARCRIRAGKRLQQLYQEVKKAGCRTEEDSFALVRELFHGEAREQEERIERTGRQLENAFSFMEEAFGESQELVIFLTQLTRNYYSMQFISANGSEKYYQYNKSLLMGEDSGKIRERIRYMLEEEGTG